MATPTTVSPAPGARLPVVASSAYDCLVAEYFSYLLRNSDDSRAGREDMYSKLESTGFEIGYRLAFRYVHKQLTNCAT
jgi:hypothetical protein